MTALGALYDSTLAVASLLRHRQRDGDPLGQRDLDAIVAQLDRAYRAAKQCQAGHEAENEA